MIKGIGLDVTEIERINVAHDRTSKFKERILTAQEIERFEKLMRRDNLNFWLVVLLRKKHFAKALGTGIGKIVAFTI